MCVKKTAEVSVGARVTSERGVTNCRATKTRKMSFASDKLYKGYLRRNMPTIVSKVKVREIVAYLPCLTDHDRENIEAKRETCGNYDSMMILLDCLKRRENWPEQFIKALEACDHPTIAAEIRAEYNALRGTNNSNPSSPPTTVIRAHVHPAPSASHLSNPESSGNSGSDVALPAEASAPPEPAAQASPPLGVHVPLQDPQTSVVHVPEAVSPPEPVAEPPQSSEVEVAPPPSTPPPSPEIPRVQVAAAPPPQREGNYHQEPVENSESDIQDISVDNQVSARNAEVSINSEVTPQPPRPVEQCETGTPSHPDPLQTTTCTEVRPPQSPSPTHMNSDVTDGSSFPTMTPEKPPVQDTSPPVVITPAAVLETEASLEAPATQVVESSPRTEAAATASPLPCAAGMDASLCDNSTVCLSKPGHLVSIHPQNHSSPSVPANSAPVEPYSGDSERLEISDAAPEAVTSSRIPACSAVSTTTATTVSALPCQENGIALNYNEPEENHYESLSQSLEGQEVLVNVLHISEEPSILDLGGQYAAPQAQDINGEACSAPPLSTCAADIVSSVNTPSSETCHPSEPADISPELVPEEKTASRTLPTNTKYIVAAGVGACALLMAWRFKN